MDWIDLLKALSWSEDVWGLEVQCAAAVRRALYSSIPTSGKETQSLLSPRKLLLTSVTMVDVLLLPGWVARETLTAPND